MANTTPVKLWRRSKIVSNDLGKKGRILYYTVVRLPSKQFAQQAPYPVIIVQLDKGERAIGQVVDWEESDLQSGQKVVAVLRRISINDGGEGVISYGIKFKPI